MIPPGLISNTANPVTQRLIMSLSAGVNATTVANAIIKVNIADTKEYSHNIKLTPGLHVEEVVTLKVSWIRAARFRYRRQPSPKG